MGVNGRVGVFEMRPPDPHHKGVDKAPEGEPFVPDPSLDSEISGGVIGRLSAADGSGEGDTI